MTSTPQPVPTAKPKPILVCPDCTNDDQSLLDSKHTPPGQVYCENCSHTFRYNSAMKEQG